MESLYKNTSASLRQEYISLAYSGTVVMIDSLSKGVDSSTSSIVESNTIGESDARKINSCKIIFVIRNKQSRKRGALQVSQNKSKLFRNFAYIFHPKNCCLQNNVQFIYLHSKTCKPENIFYIMQSNMEQNLPNPSSW